jgi:hypothetical protein
VQCETNIVHLDRVLGGSRASALVGDFF